MKKIKLTRQTQLSTKEEKEIAETITLNLAKFGYPVVLDQIPLECAGVDSTVELCGGFPVIIISVDEADIK